jgi:hypothetical protein
VKVRTDKVAVLEQGLQHDDIFAVDKVDKVNKGKSKIIDDFFLNK